ncbi:hypothetical protein [Photobacterium kishitanii]|uniref:Uncharacterized protein n=1 Tax=Photobacterium kishitanii TaxID=318456 RepID=A0A2T3KJU4_9GAMM|nr:hypothetical protein [Photobacterium kishitanii]PSU99775.1 hypothetical protein C9J27_09115 [Photobacterium kishitanii]
MEVETQAIVAAIESLQSNPIKDYILPMGGVFVSGLLGMGVAYYTVNRQEKTKLELHKVETINETLLHAQEVRARLISIKQNYVRNIDSDPVSRTLAIPPILLSEQRIEVHLSRLAFMVPDSSQGKVSKWQSIDYVSTIFSNYNYLLELWKKRNEIIIGLQPKLGHLFRVGLNFENLVTAIGVATLVQLADLTERVLVMTDDVLIEVSCFLVGFGSVAKSQVDKKVTRNLSKTIQVTLPDSSTYPLAVDMLSRVPELNFDAASQLHNIPVNILKERYRPLYR